MRTQSSSRSGFTILDLIMLIAGVVVLLVIATIVLTALTARPTGGRSMRDATSVRAIHQGMIMWAQNNNDQFPLPSLLDRHNTTVAQEGEAKNTTANIMSMMVAYGLISPELLISRQEANPAIQEYEGYEYDRPSRAVDPEKAHWDPGLAADFTSPAGGNISWAHLIPAGGERQRWGSTSTYTYAALGTRGPEITSVREDRRGRMLAVLANDNSLTKLLHEPRHSWSGHIAFSDNAVILQHELHAGTYTNTQGQARPDFLHYNHSDDPSGLNHYLGIFIRAGGTRDDFKAIWD